MFHRHIESVTLKRLSDTSFQRRGHIAVFKLIEKVNMPYIQQEAIKQIQALYAVLGYVTPPSLVGKNGEQSESWISIGEDGKEIFFFF